MKFPTIHLNGTGRNALIEQYRASLHAVNEAIEVLRQNGPHGRDYYTQEEDTFGWAVNEHMDRIAAMVKVKDELVQILNVLRSP